MKTSVCILTLNEERGIERAINSAKWADEILIVDAGSTDNTVILAQKCGAKVSQNKWNGFAAQRNFALNQASGDWILFLDADEEITDPLSKKLLKISHENPSLHPNCYSIQRNEFFLGKELKYGAGNPSHQWRFFKKGSVHFAGEVHEYPVFAGDVGVISDGSINHWPELDIDRFLKKLNHYTTLEAIDRFEQGQRTSLIHACATFFTTFLKNGISYRGLLNGKEGFVLLLLESFSRVVRHLKLWVFWQVYEGRIKINIKLPEPGSKKPISKDELQKPEWQAK